MGETRTTYTKILETRVRKTNMAMLVVLLHPVCKNMPFTIIIGIKLYTYYCHYYNYRRSKVYVRSDLPYVCHEFLMMLLV